MLGGIINKVNTTLNLCKHSNREPLYVDICQECYLLLTVLCIVSELPHLKSIEYRNQILELTGNFSPSRNFGNNFTVIKQLLSANHVFTNSSGNNNENFHNYC